MTPAVVAAAVADAHRREWSGVLAATIRVSRDLDVAEECVQEAFASALTSWSRDGIPDNLAAWLTTAAKRKVLDGFRRETLFRNAAPLLVDDPVHQPDTVDDDRLRLIFTCAHPALSPDAQVALTLRMVCGLDTDDIARAFLVSRATMAARITRAKRKIAQAGIPYRVPPPEEFGPRVDAVLTVVYLVFTTGHTATSGAGLVRDDLANRALDLARMLRLLLPNEADVAGLHALLLLTDSRRATRTDADGELVLLRDQDRAQWDRRAIADGIALTKRALRGGSVGRYSLMAAIAAVHAEAGTWADTDWVEIAGLYDHLIAAWPSPIVALNRAIAISYADGPAAGLAALEPLRAHPQLAGYQYLPAARAEMLVKLGRPDDARIELGRALSLAGNPVEAAHLRRRIAELDGAATD